MPAIINFLQQTGFYMFGQDGNGKCLIMIAISFILMYLAIVKGFEPLLLLPISFGMLCTNLPGADMFHEILFAGGHVHWDLFGGTPVTAPDDSLSFGAAVELAVAMPLSWLPLISDYTREAEKPFAATLSSTLTYGVVSCWMYVIGMGAAIFTGEGDIALIMVKAGLGVAALLILILSTVTTTFLDAYSAGISAESLSKKINGKYAALIVTVIGTICAICFPMDDITNFLYLIGSVFAPMIAIQITDFFLLKRGGASGKLDVCNAVVWVLGFVLYRVLMTVDIPVGNTLPDMAGTMLLCLIAHKIVPDKVKAA